MAGYQSVAQYKTRTALPAAYVDTLETIAPGFIAAQLEMLSRVDIDAPLRIRYDAPFSEPVPVAVTAWLTRLMDVVCLNRRGVDATDLNYAWFEKEAERTREEIKLAANAVDGLYDLPLRDSEKTSGVRKGGARYYSEQGPYVGFDMQRRIGRGEDYNGGGSRG